MKCTNEKMTWNIQDMNLSWYVPKANVDHTINWQGTAVSTLDLSATTPRDGCKMTAILGVYSTSFTCMHDLYNVISNENIQLRSATNYIQLVKEFSSPNQSDYFQVRVKLLVITWIKWRMDKSKTQMTLWCIVESNCISE